MFAIGPFDRPDDAYHAQSNSYPNFAPNLGRKSTVLQPAMRAYFAAMEILSRRLAGYMARALGLEDWFADKLDRASQLRLLTGADRELEHGQLRAARTPIWA